MNTFCLTRSHTLSSWGSHFRKGSISTSRNFALFTSPISSYETTTLCGFSVFRKSRLTANLSLIFCSVHNDLYWSTFSDLSRAVTVRNSKNWSFKRNDDKSLDLRVSDFLFGVVARYHRDKHYSSGETKGKN